MEENTEQTHSIPNARFRQKKCHHPPGLADCELHREGETVKLEKTSMWGSGPEATRGGAPRGLASGVNATHSVDVKSASSWRLKAEYLRRTGTRTAANRHGPVLPHRRGKQKEKKDKLYSTDVSTLGATEDEKMPRPRLVVLG